MEEKDKFMLLDQKSLGSRPNRTTQIIKHLQRNVGAFLFLLQHNLHTTVN
jgi:hypothetical protein